MNRVKTDTALWHTIAILGLVSLLLILAGVAFAGGVSRHGGNGPDKLVGTTGEDTLIGNAGDDQLYGGAATDRLFGGSGDDKIEGDFGGDKMHGGLGDDRLDGGAAHDDIYGDEGNDWIYGGSGHDSIYGGEGRDTLIAGSTYTDISGGSGNDTVYSVTPAVPTVKNAINCAKAGSEKNILGLPGGSWGCLVFLCFNSHISSPTKVGFTHSSCEDIPLQSTRPVARVDCGDGEDRVYIDSWVMATYMQSRKHFENRIVELKRDIERWPSEAAVVDSKVAKYQRIVQYYERMNESNPSKTLNTRLYREKKQLLFWQKKQRIGSRMFRSNQIDLARLESEDAANPDKRFVLGRGPALDYENCEKFEVSKFPLKPDIRGVALFGGDGKDRLLGTNASDKLLGGGGSDTIFGGRGGDILWGETAPHDRPGNDRIVAGPGNDRVWGNGGNDRIYGGPGRDFIVAGVGNDYIDGGPGRDTIVTNSGRDHVVHDPEDTVRYR